MKTSTLFRSLLPASALLVGAPVALTSIARAESIQSSVADARGDVAKTQLQELDAQLDRLDDLEDNAPTAEERAAAKVRIETLKQRRSELRKNYAQARYDSLKADVKGEYTKMSAWSKRSFSRTGSNLDRNVERMNDRATDAVQDTGRAARDVKNDVIAASNPAALETSADIAAYRANPNDQTKAEVKASLSSLEADIDQLEQRADALPRGDERDAAKLRVKALKERRSELSGDFRKARYEILKADVKAEWNKIVH